MKILTIAPTNSPHALRPVRALLAAGHSVCFYGYPPQDPLAGEHWPNYTFVADPVEDGLPKSEAELLTSSHILQTVYDSFQPDITHIHWISWHLLVASRYWGGPVVVSVWGSDLNSALREQSDGGYTWQEDQPYPAHLLPLASTIIVDDPTMLAKCAFAAPKVPVMLLPLGVDDVFFDVDAHAEQRIRKRLSLTQKDIFTSCRILNPLYRTADIIQAFNLAARGKDAVLVLRKFHARPESVRMLRHLVSELGMMEQIRFYGTLVPADLRDLYAASTAVLNFPAQDAFPVTFAEAGACGTHMITCMHPAYDVPLVREYFEILPENSVEALAAAIARCMQEKPQTQRAAMQDLTRRTLSHQAYVEGLQNLYESLLASGAKQ